jgi:CO/xanthine dehydrogenase Mo-binding subunit
MASRSTVTASAAIHHASARLRDKVFAIAAHLLECAPADLELRDGGVGVVGVPGATISLQKVAQAALTIMCRPIAERILTLGYSRSTVLDLSTLIPTVARSALQSPVSTRVPPSFKLASMVFGAMKSTLFRERQHRQSRR